MASEEVLQHQAEARRSVGATPRLNKDILIRLSPEDVMRIMAIALDQNRDEAFEFVTERLGKLLQKELQKPG